MSKLAVVALGGNALQRDYQKGTIEEQEQNTFETLENLIFLLREGFDLVITHGNGPQVGDILLKNDAGESAYNIPQMPLDICVAGTQGEIGYMIERILRNVLNKHKIQKNVISLISQVVVNHKGEAFKNPTKRIGRIYSNEMAEKLSKEKKWIFKEEKKSNNGLRRVVPSPEPLDILNKKIIKQLVDQDNIVIAAGGGGIPVYIDEKNDVRPVEAVIDKDIASALLASSIGANEFYILTDVPYVYLNYKKPDQEIAEFLDYNDTIKYLEQGMFGEGNMKPKIEAALFFIRQGGSTSIITEATKLQDKRFGSKITMVYDPTDTRHTENY
ncbi:MAG: carbamate kinase [Bacteroidales bacterium]|nr:carbamate kinase [Bacteroidales bacterium]MBN2763029.1 carbamate kinase [Bacteroidales bacterium]